METRENIGVGLDPLEENIVQTAYAHVYAQRMLGMIERWHGKVRAGASSKSPVLHLKRRALGEIGMGADQIPNWEGITSRFGEKLSDLVVQHQIWDDWAYAVKGLGPTMTGLIMAAIGDVTRVHNASGLWKSFGLHVEGGLAAKLQPGKQGRVGFPFARLVLGRVRVTFMKVGSQHGGYYYNIYEQARNRYDATRPEWPEGRRFGAAIRYFEKILLAHFWEVWREIKKLPAPAPFIIARDVAGVHTKMEPEEAMEMVKKPARVASR